MLLLITYITKVYTLVRVKYLIAFISKIIKLHTYLKGIFCINKNRMEYDLALNGDLPKDRPWDNQAVVNGSLCCYKWPFSPSLTRHNPNTTRKSTLQSSPTTISMAD